MNENRIGAGFAVCVAPLQGDVQAQVADESFGARDDEEVLRGLGALRGSDLSAECLCAQQRLVPPAKLLSFGKSLSSMQIAVMPAAWYS